VVQLPTPAEEPDARASPATTSIANRLLQIIFVVYFGITLVVTLVQLYSEYRHAEGRVHAEIEAMRQTFGPGIANAMWRFQQDVLHGILRGMSALPTVAGVKVLDQNGQLVSAVGTVLDAQGQPALAGPDGALQPMVAEQGFFARSVGHGFAVIYVDERNQPRQIGHWVVYSNPGVVLQQVQFGFLLIFISAVIKTLALWLIFLYVVQRWLGQPLRQLTDFVAQIDIHNLGDKAFVLQDQPRHELHFLADSVNNSTRKLRHSIENNQRLYHRLLEEQQALKSLNETLEQRVAQRTVQLQQANRQLAALSATDGLTGLANRRHFDEVLAIEWSRAQRLGQPLTLAMLDVDWFKLFNDHYGHLAGDECLRQVARLMQGSVRRAGDLVARYGGEEFAIIAPGLDSRQARSMAEAVCAAIAEHAMPHALSEFGCVTASIGVVSLLPRQDDSAAALLALVDQALYRAKSAGRNRVEQGHRP